MSYREWLAEQLVADGFIPSSDYIDECTTIDSLLCETELEADDLSNYYSEFEEYCKNIGKEPFNDIEEY